jgi:hypothetical protein
MTAGTIKAAGWMIRSSGPSRLHDSVHLYELEERHGTAVALRAPHDREPLTMRSDHRRAVSMDPEIDLVADLNAPDDDGCEWSLLWETRDAAQVMEDRFGPQDDRSCHRA